MNCSNCKSTCIRKGRQRNGMQKYRCTGCGKWLQEQYRYKAYEDTGNSLLKRLLAERVSKRGIARVMGVSTVTVLRRVKAIKVENEKRYPSPDFQRSRPGQCVIPPRP